MIEPENIESLFLGAQKIGIACGPVSGGLECIDFDAHKNEPIRRIFNDYMANTGVSTIVEGNNLPILKTPSGGYHILYKCASENKGRAWAKWPDNSVMIETRSHGQYIATIPSKGYTLLKGCEIIKMPIITEDERDYLLMVAESFTQAKIDSTVINGSGKWPKAFDTSTAWGMFNENGLDEAKQLLYDKGWIVDRIRKHDGVELWRRPGKEKGISATLGQFHNMFYNWSSSVEYCEQEKGYSLFDILMRLKFDGDKVEAIKYLEKKYNIIHYKPSVTKKTVDFPIDIFPEKLQAYILQQNKQNNHDVNLLCSVSLWLFSVLIGNKFTTFINEGWNVSPVMWLMIIADRGSSKTHAINTIIKPLRKIDSKKKIEFDSALAAYDDESKEKRPTWKQSLLEDGTREGYTKAMIHNPGGLGLMKDELDGWLSDMDKHSASKGGDESFWLSSYNNGSYTKNIKSEDAAHVPRMFISLAGSIQPGVLDEIMQRHVVNGLFDRFLLVPYEDTNFQFSLTPPKISYYQWYTDFIEYAYASFNQFEDLEFHISEDAESTFEDCYNYFLKVKHTAENVKISAYMAKIITMFPRIALIIELITQIYSIFEGGKGGEIVQKVQRNAILKSFDVMKYFINNAQNLVFDVDLKHDMANIIKASGAIKRNDKAVSLLSAIARNELNCSKVEVAKFTGLSKQMIQYLGAKVQKKEVNSKTLHSNSKR